MPHYEYSCSHCGCTREVFQKITDSPLEVCPDCGLQSFVRGVGGGSAIFRFIGKGFYQNDYRHSKPDSEVVKSSCCQNTTADARESSCCQNTTVDARESSCCQNTTADARESSCCAQQQEETCCRKQDACCRSDSGE